MADLAARLTEALDRAEQGYGGGHFAGCDEVLTDGRLACDCDLDGFVARLIARDRALLADYAHAEAAFADPTSALATTVHVARNNRRLALRTEIERAAAFWLPTTTEGVTP